MCIISRILYIISMALSSPSPILGLDVGYLHHRKGRRALYSGKAKTEKSRHFTLLLVTDGRIRMERHAAVSMAIRGCVSLWPPDSRMDFRALPGTPCSYFLMGFRPLLADGPARTLEEIGFDPLFRLANPGPVERLFAELDGIFNSSARYRLTRASETGLRILLALRPYTVSARPFPNLPDNRDPMDRVETAVAYVHRNFRKRISVSALADMVSMHPVNFIRAFKKATGLTPHQYLLAQKVEKAKDFLFFNQDSPISAAHTLGFHDYAHFLTVFRKRTGMTPAAYRRQAGCPRNTGSTLRMTR